MKKTAVIFTFFLIFITVFSVDIEKIRELKDLGFTNEQITEMLSSDGGKTENKNSISVENLEYLNNLKKENKGLVIVCFTKLWSERGPGYLEFDNYVDNERKAIDTIPILNYKDGGQGSSTTSFAYNHFFGLQANTRTNRMILSVYYKEIPMEAKTYSLLKVQRKFKMAEMHYLRRYKSFENIDIEPGKVTILNHFWDTNREFGIKKPTSNEHIDFINEVEKKYQDYVNNIIE